MYNRLQVLSNDFTTLSDHIACLRNGSILSICKDQHVMCVLLTPQCSLNSSLVTSNGAVAQ